MKFTMTPPRLIRRTWRWASDEGATNIEQRIVFSRCRQTWGWSWSGDQRWTLHVPVANIGCSLNWELLEADEIIGTAKYHQRFLPWRSNGILWQVGGHQLSYSRFRSATLLKTRGGDTLAAWQWRSHPTQLHGVTRMVDSRFIAPIILGIVFADFLWRDPS